ncbi:tetratricopeptide repeat protein [Caryophanon tenue]|uniref:Sel1 repeat family protein n=1 Tax=Caryophanon tenue TaxID=33978 RepID=A0A1C0Y7D9_9BACL|nr:tetratricopeptide repeat protein [Caryophanon tenue]OCS83071.1 hypothetical protein A6M13_06625 [Caryophanon tenue]
MLNQLLGIAEKLLQRGEREQVYQLISASQYVVYKPNYSLQKSIEVFHTFLNTMYPSNEMHSTPTMLQDVAFMGQFDEAFQTLLYKFDAHTKSTVERPIELVEAGRAVELLLPIYMYYFETMCEEEIEPTQLERISEALIDVYYDVEANRGDAKASFEIALNHLNGPLELYDVEKALDRLHKSANEGHFYANTIIGIMYLDGEHVEKDEEKAVAYLKLAAESGEDEACEQLGLFFYEKQDYRAAYYWLKKTKSPLASEGWTKLAEMYLHGHFVKQDYDKAFAFLTRAVALHEPEAQYYLGFLYENGFGVMRDIQTAYEYYMLAADQQYEPAINMLALLNESIFV